MKSWSHSFRNLVIAPTPFSMGSLRAPKKWKSEGVIFRPFGGWGKTDYPSFLLACFVCFQNCACFFLGGFSAIFLWGSALLKHFCMALRVWTHRSEFNSLITHNDYQKGGHDLCWRGSPKFLLWSRSLIMPFHWLSFRLQSKVMDPFFIPIDNPWQKAFTIIPAMGEQIWTNLFQ